jgi:hypothetical protein
MIECLSMRNAGHERGVGERAGQPRVEFLGVLDDSVIFGQVPAASGQWLGGIKPHVENRPRNRRIYSLELSKKLRDLIR